MHPSRQTTKVPVVLPWHKLCRPSNSAMHKFQLSRFNNNPHQHNSVPQLLWSISLRDYIKYKLHCQLLVHRSLRKQQTHSTISDWSCHFFQRSSMVISHLLFSSHKQHSMSLVASLSPSDKPVWLTKLDNPKRKLATKWDVQQRNKNW